MSLSARRAWIEIISEDVSYNIIVSLSARRAWIEIIDYIIDYATDASLSARRAWIEISLLQCQVKKYSGSLSARRAWIEITTRTRTPTGCVVALRKESVDRNTTIITICIAQKRSLSARRAWIEIVS